MCAKFYRNRTFNFKVMIKKTISDEKIRISLRQSWIKRLGQFVRYGSKSLPLSPNAVLIRVMLPEAAPGRPTLIDGGGEGYDKWGVRRLPIKQCIAPNVLTIASTGIIAIKWIKCPNFFFPGL